MALPFSSIGFLDPALLVAALSRARTDPESLAARVKARLPLFKGKTYHPPDRGGVVIPTKEGAKAVQEALAFLKEAKPRPPLDPPPDDVSARALALAAQDHVVDRGTLGLVGHDGDDGSHPHERIGRYGVSRGASSECLWFGRILADADDAVADLVIDDGVASRGHRLCIYDERYRVAMAFVGDHATFGQMACIEFAAAYEGDAAKVSARQASGPPQPSPPDGLQKKGSNTQWKLGACAGCGQPISGGAVVEVKGLPGKYHKVCFVCAECAKPLAGQTFSAKDGHPYCSSCHTEKFAPTCGTCGEKIPPGTSFVKGPDGTAYHKGCSPKSGGGGGGADGGPVCAVCGEKIPPGVKFAKSGGKSYHGACVPASGGGKSRGAAVKAPASGATKKTSMSGARAGMGGLMGDLKGLE